MRKASAEETQKIDAPIKEKKQKDSFKLRIPMISFRNTPINVYLVGVLVIFAFLLGMLTNKVLFLESSVKTLSQTTAQAAAAAAPTAAPTPPQVVDVTVGHLPPLGDPKAKVKIVAFEDFRCPFCDQFYKDSLSQLKKDYLDNGKAVLYYRENQFLGPASVTAGNAAECANEQGQFWTYHNYLYENQPPESDTSMYTTDKLTEIAGNLGLDSDKFNACLSSNKFNKDVQTDLQDGQKAQVDGTPTLFINGYRIVGAVPYDQLKQQIDLALKK
jgi:protein-disulfide isomerase